MDDPVDAGLRSRPTAATQGHGPLDLLFTGATVVDVSTGELRPADVGVVGPLIASVRADLHGPEVEKMLPWPEVGGLAEVMDMMGALTRDRRMVDVVAAGVANGKLVSGHAGSDVDVDLTLVASLLAP